MKIRILVVACVTLLVIVSCSNNSGEIEKLKAQVAELQVKVDSAYKPGLGEFMSYIQVHHDKLWFAGLNQNWPLADFELKEISETVGDIQKYVTDRPEARLVIMLNPFLDSVKAAIALKNSAAFKSSFETMTNTCNDCHGSVENEFNVIKIPDTPPFTNQAFEMQKGH